MKERERRGEERRGEEREKWSVLPLSARPMEETDISEKIFNVAPTRIQVQNSSSKLDPTRISIFNSIQDVYLIPRFHNMPKNCLSSNVPI